MIVDLPADCWPVASLILSACRDPGVRPWKQLLKVLCLLRASKSVSGEQFFTATWPIFTRVFLVKPSQVLPVSPGHRFYFCFYSMPWSILQGKAGESFNFPHQDIFQNSHWILKVVGARAAITWLLWPDIDRRPAVLSFAEDVRAEEKHSSARGEITPPF